MKRLVTICIVMVAIGGTASALPINFDEYPDDTLISNQYASQGVLFLAGTVTGRLPQISPDPPMPTEPVLRPTGEPEYGMFQGDFWMQFTSPVSDVQFISGYWDAVGTGVIDVYGPGMNLLASLSNTITGPELISISGLGSIGHIYFNSIADPGGADIDSLNFTAVIPVPGTFLLGGIGTGLVTWLRRRRTL